MKVYYKKINNTFLGFYHFIDEEFDKLEEKEKYFLIEKEEFDSLINKGTEVYWSNKNRKLQVVPENLEVNYIKKSFNYENEVWEEKATLEESIEYYKNLIIEKTREHELLKASGFSGTQEEINLQVEIENLKQIYMDKNHELALQIENRLRKKK